MSHEAIHRSHRVGWLRAAVLQLLLSDMRQRQHCNHVFLQAISYMVVRQLALPGSADF